MYQIDMQHLALVSMRIKLIRIPVITEVQMYSEQLFCCWFRLLEYIWKKITNICNVFYGQDKEMHRFDSVNTFTNVITP